MDLIEIYFIIMNVLIIVSNIVLILVTIMNKDRGDVSK